MDTNGSIRKAYVECVQLQQQLNVVQRTILRLRQQKPHQPYTMVPISSPALAVKKHLHWCATHHVRASVGGAAKQPLKERWPCLCPCAVPWMQSPASQSSGTCVWWGPQDWAYSQERYWSGCVAPGNGGESFLAAALKEFFQSDQPNNVPSR